MEQITLGAIAERIGAKLVGDSQYPITGLATLADALPHHVSFLANMKYRHMLDNSRAGAVIMHSDQAQFFSGHGLLLGNPYVGYAKLSQIFPTNLIFWELIKHLRLIRRQCLEVVLI